MWPRRLGEPDDGESSTFLWPDQRYGWRFATPGCTPDDLWLADCDEVVREVTP